MISVINDAIFNKIVNCYNTVYAKGFLSKPDERVKQLKVALLDKSYVVHNEAFTGFLVMLPYDNRLALNPWFFNGYPVGDDAMPLQEEAMTFYEESNYDRIELIGDQRYLHTKKILIPYSYDYIDMEMMIDKRYQINEKFGHISDYNEDHLKKIYHQSFSQSDAMFYTLQTDYGKTDFWKYLNYDQALTDPCSLAIVRDEILVGFIFSNQINQGKHISCMCILPAYQHQGLGTILLKGFSNLAQIHGNDIISLGTEESMKAYKLYKKFGFIDIARRSYYIKKG